MACVRDGNLIDRMSKANVSRRDACNYLPMSYGTLTNMLNGYIALPASVRFRIEELIKKTIEGGHQ